MIEFELLTSLAKEVYSAFQRGADELVCDLWLFFLLQVQAPAVHDVLRLDDPGRGGELVVVLAAQSCEIVRRVLNRPNNFRRPILLLFLHSRVVLHDSLNLLELFVE